MTIFGLIDWIMSETRVPLLSNVKQLIGCDYSHYREEFEKKELKNGFGRTSYGKYDGHINFFSDNGDLSQIITYENGVRDGYFVSYSPDHTVSCQGLYDHGKIITFSYFDKNMQKSWSEAAIDGYHYSAEDLVNKRTYRFSVDNNNLAHGAGLCIEGDKKKKVNFKHGMIGGGIPWSFLGMMGLVAAGVVFFFIMYARCLVY